MARAPTNTLHLLTIAESLNAQNEDGLRLCVDVKDYPSVGCDNRAMETAEKKINDESSEHFKHGPWTARST